MGVRCIEIRNLSVRAGNSYILEDISLDIDCGDIVVVTGPSGGGKSTLIKILSGAIDILRDRRLSVEGYISILGIDVFRDGFKRLIGRIATIFQNPVNQIFMLSVEEEISFALENLGLDRNTIIDRVNRALKIMGIENLRNRQINTLSMGQLQRVLLASIIALEPDIILMDEPCAYIDPATKRVFYRAIEDIWRKKRNTMIIVEHDIDYILGIATKILILDKRVIAYGNPIEILNKIDIESYGIQEPLYTKICRALKTSINPLDEKDIIKCIKKAICIETSKITT